MIELAGGYPVPVPARKPDLRKVKEAAGEVGVHEMTIWRWLRHGLITRHKSAPYGPRATLVDVNEIRELMSRPPTATPKPDPAQDD